MLRSSAAAISGPRRQGSRRAIAISAGSAPSWIRRETWSATASASPRVPAERSSTRPSPAATGSAPGDAEARGEREQGRARGVGRVGRGRLLGGDADPLAQRLQQATAGRQRGVARLVGEGDGELGPGGELGEQLELVRGEVVEAVDEDRALAPEPGVVAQRGDRLAGDAVAVEAAEPVAGGGVGGEQGGDVAQVGRALERRGAGLDRPRLDPGALQLVEQSLQRRGEARPARRAPERSEPLGPRGDRGHRAQPLCRGQGRRRRRAGRGRDRAEQGTEGDRVGAQRGAGAAEPRSKEKTSSRVGTTRTGSLPSSARRRARTSPRLPELGGPWIRFSGTDPPYARPRRTPRPCRPRTRSPASANCGRSRSLLPSTAPSRFIPSKCPSAS